MPSVQSDDFPPPIRSPKCPACNKEMRLERALPDVRFVNLTHFLYKCDCGWESDQLVAMKDYGD